MRFTKIFGASALLLTTALSAVSAQAQMFPDDSFNLVGEVAGFNVFTVEGAQGVWLISPDGYTVINGDLYDLSGPVPLLNFQPEPALGEHADPIESSIAPAPAAALAAPPAIAVTPLPPAAAAAPAVPAVPAPGISAPASAPDDIVAALLGQAEGALAGVDNAKKNEALVDLVTRMESASTPEEFQLSIIEWQAELEGKTAIADQARTALAEILAQRRSAPAEAAPGVTAPPAPPEAAPAPIPAAPSAAPSVTPEELGQLEERINQGFPQVIMPTGQTAFAAAHAAQDTTAAPADAAGDDSALLFTEMRMEGHWFSVGRIGAPTVYAIIDPMCPYCARSIANLSGEIERGEIDLRVMLTPVISKAAPAKIAGILLSENPAQAFVSHELDYHNKGASSVPDRDFAELSPEMNAAIKKNHDIVIKNGLPGVPFFAYVTNDGIRFSSGVPEAGKFADALPDPYLGTN